jgi:NAD(P)H-hydrate epimerase
MRVVKAAEMREMDRMTIRDIGIPGVVLMENAARGASRIFFEHFRPPPDSRVLILCGRGNNGGDGYVVARYLFQAGHEVTVAILSPLEKIQGDALINLNIIQKLGIETHELPDNKAWDRIRPRMKDCDYIIDAILGTGLNAPVRGYYRQVIGDVNGSGNPVMALDIPSGLNADTGQVMGEAVRADLTVTFGLPKPGQLVFPGAELVGRLVGVDIGIPDAVVDKIPPTHHLIESEDFLYLLQDTGPAIHKGRRGHLFILAGSTGKTGAAVLTAIGALRAGAGLVTLGCPASLNPVMEGKLTEAMTVPLPDTGDGFFSSIAKDTVFKQNLLEGKTALTVGPGLGAHEETIQFVHDILQNTSLPVVLDADGLNALSKKMDILNTRPGQLILTPHPGEMERLTRIKSSDIQQDRLAAARHFVEQYGCYLVLKGARTLVACPDGNIHINPTGNPLLSTGGTGDVLAGMIGGFLARGLPVIQACQAGVYLHGLAADLLSERIGNAGLLAGELLSVLPELTASLLRGERPLKTGAGLEGFEFL